MSLAPNQQLFEYLKLHPEDTVIMRDGSTRTA